MSSEQKRDRVPSKLLWAVWALFFVSMLIMFSFLFRINSQVEDLEELLSYSPPEQNSQVTAPAMSGSANRSYVPVYSHVYSSGGRPVLLETTLSIRNIDLEKQLIVNEVNYYDSTGEMVREFIDAPLTVGPLATIEFLVEQKDVEGGSGANFIVRWGSAQSIKAPLIEAVMVGSNEDECVSFVRQGVPIE